MTDGPRSGFLETGADPPPRVVTSPKDYAAKTRPGIARQLVPYSLGGPTQPAGSDFSKTVISYVLLTYE
jgi:hypothetical protein